jgi:hypothetical protein
MKGKSFIGGEQSPNLSDEKLLRLLEPSSGNGFKEDMIILKNPTSGQGSKIVRSDWWDKKSKGEKEQMNWMDDIYSSMGHGLNGGSNQYGLMMSGRGFVQDRRVSMNVADLYGQTTYNNPMPVPMPMDGGMMEGDGAVSEALKKFGKMVAVYAKKGLALFKSNLPRLIKISKDLKLGSKATEELANKLNLPQEIKDALLAGVASTGFGMEGGRITGDSNTVPLMNSELPKNSRERSVGGFGNNSYRRAPFNHSAYAYVPSGGLVK